MTVVVDDRKRDRERERERERERGGGRKLMLRVKRTYQVPKTVKR